MSLSKRPLDFNPLPHSQKRVRVTPDPSISTENGSSQNFPLSEPIPMDIDESVEESVEDICYGALCEVHGSLNGSNARALLIRDSRRFQQLRIVPHNDTFGLVSEKNHIIAILDVGTCEILRVLQGYQRIAAAAVVETSKLKQSSAKGSSRGIFTLSINICGPQNEVDKVGDRLSEIHVFLQHPFFLERGYEYFNPQYFHSGGEMKCMTHLVGISETEHRAKHISDVIECVLGNLETMPWDDPSLEAQAQPNAIIIPLKGHQRSALRFIQRRENQDVCQNTNKSLRRFLGTSPKDDIPSNSMGGILADVMGLGKTLSMISAVVSSLPQAHEYTTAQHRKFVSSASTCRSRATLVVVTSMQVLEGWNREVTTRLKAGTLKVCIFHGPNRPKSLGGVVDHDLVLTTFATLSMDSKKLKVLQNIEWYRVVLDEAHWIRNQTSNQFSAAESLISERKWCLTGTPIQNRLNDLESLLRFLHFDPFSRASVFQKHILEPLSKDSPDRARNLRELLCAICLRRNEKYLNLPEPVYEEISVTLETGERMEYNTILKKCARDIDDLVSTRERFKKHCILFAAVVKLRRLCNHGTLSSSQASLSVTLPTGAEDETDCDFCSGNDKDKLALLGKTKFCTECGRSISRTSQEAASKSSASGSGSSAPSGPSNPDIYRSSPSSFLTPPHVPHGYSTKLTAVIDNLARTPIGSKSLVFSYWTSTLSYLEVLLKQKSINYLRIDGKVPYKERLKILDHFSGQQHIAVLLMSVGSGAVGLNLTAANYVHLVEPQWNPSVEEQAIARALRMGQTRTVTVKRYIVKGTVEENIRSLQKKKSALAKFTLDSGSEEGESSKLEDLQFILDLDFTE